MDEPDGGEPDIRFIFTADAEIGIGADGGATTSTGLGNSAGSSGGISDRRFFDRDECFRTGASAVSVRDLCLRGAPVVSDRDLWRDERCRSWGGAGSDCDRKEMRGSAEIEIGRFPPVGETS